MGKAVFAVKETDLNGHEALELSFDFSAKVLLFKVSDRTRSYICPETMGMFRYTKSEKSPLGGHNEDVSADPSKGMLDELSFIYLVRGLDLEPGQSVEIRRHFDEARNPVVVNALPNEVMAGQNVVVYEMKVRDARQKSGTSTLKFWISADAARQPLRIETTMPMAGRVTMTLVRPGIKD
jgi:hypothetical protein